MNINTGDKVRFLNEKREGTVTRIINKTTVNVVIEDDFEIPVLISELVVITDTTNEKTVASLIQHAVSKTEKVAQTIKTIQEGIYIAFSPENANDIQRSNMNVWFINQTAYKTLFTFSVFKNQMYTTLEAGEMNAFSSALIDTMEKNQIEQLSNFKLDVVFYDTKSHTSQPPVSERIKFKIVKLYKENIFEENDFIPEKAYIINVAQLDNESEFEKSKINQEELSKVLLQNRSSSTGNIPSKPHAINNPALELEIDLHIHELVDKYTHLNNYEIMQIQLKHFQNALDKAIIERYRKLIVIHGVGKLKLKQEVLNLLATYPNVKAYDASYAKYGFGATEVLIKQ
ncbi:MAG: DUF2027 domain-containing protein [Bacteroidota bacterium]